MCGTDGTTYAPWDGQSEEGTLPRPGHKYPWVYVVQEDDDRDGYVWGVKTQAGTTFTAQGHAPSVAAARAAAARSVGPLTADG